MSLQGMVLLNPEELVMAPVRIPEDMLPHEKVGHYLLLHHATGCLYIEGVFEGCPRGNYCLAEL